MPPIFFAIELGGFINIGHEKRRVNSLKPNCPVLFNIMPFSFGCVKKLVRVNYHVLSEPILVSTLADPCLSTSEKVFSNLNHSC